MKTNYTIYDKDNAPEELLAKFPKAAQYSPEFYLFGRSLSDITGTPAETIVDLTSVGYTVDEAEGVSNFDGDLFVESLELALVPGVELKINKQQAQELYSRKPVEETEEI